jgi:(S)-citramalyl-CoA lyase
LIAVVPIAQADETVTAVMFGAADYAADVGAQPDALALQIARGMLASGCRSAGVLAIDSPCFALRDSQLLEGDLAFAVRNGFHAKAAIHPLHVRTINSAFTPTPERVTWARRVLEAITQSGVAILDGRMVDEAMAREARRIIEIS